MLYNENDDSVDYQTKILLKWKLFALFAICTYVLNSRWIFANGECTFFERLYHGTCQFYDSIYEFHIISLILKRYLYVYRFYLGSPFVAAIAMAITNDNSVRFRLSWFSFILVIFCVQNQYHQIVNIQHCLLFLNISNSIRELCATRILIFVIEAIIHLNIDWLFTFRNYQWGIIKYEELALKFHHILLEKSLKNSIFTRNIVKNSIFTRKAFLLGTSP